VGLNLIGADTIGILKLTNRLYSALTAWDS